MASEDWSNDRIQRKPGESMKEWIARAETAALAKKRAEYSTWSVHKKGEALTEPIAAAAKKSCGLSSDNAADSVATPLQETKTTSESGSQSNELTAEDLLNAFGSRKSPARKASRGTGPQLSKVTNGGHAKQSSKPNAPKAPPKLKSIGDDFAGLGYEEHSNGPRPGHAGKSSSAQAQNKLNENKVSDDNIPSEQRKPSEHTARPSSDKLSGQHSARPNARAANNPATLRNTHGKRPSISDADVQGQAINFGSLPKIAKKTSVASRQPSEGAISSDNSEHIASDVERPPKWYTNMGMPSNRNRNDSGVAILLERLQVEKRKGSADSVRDILHELPFQKVGREVLKRNRMLDNERGLPQLFDSKYMSNTSWPSDVQADAKELYLRWCRQDFEVDLLRGLLLKSNAKRDSGDRNNDKIDPKYTSRVDFHAFGANDLSNGQWFPTQLTTVRDGAHGATQGGISGKAGEGAYSCIMTGQSGYPDQDNGNEVLYCGTDSDDGKVTERTQMLIDNMNNNHPVRFIRKSTLKSQWAPEVGYRYDGLYSVKSFERLNTKDRPQLARHRFQLVRCPGQDPIRGTGPEKRPTQQEIERYKIDKRFR